MDREYVLDIAKKYDKIKQKAMDIATEHFETKIGKIPKNFSIDAVDIDDETTSVTYSYYAGEWTSEWYSIPTSCLWSERWKEDLLKQIEEEKEQSKKEDEQKKFECEAEREKAEKETLKRLLAKYGGAE